MAETEADTCRKLVVPMLRKAGWDDAPHAINEQRTFTDGRIAFVGGKARRGRQKRADYILRYRSHFPIFMSRSDSSEARRGLEREAVGACWEALRRAGVEDFSLGACWRQYRMSMLFSLPIMVLGRGISGAANGWTAGTSKSSRAG